MGGSEKRQRCCTHLGDLGDMQERLQHSLIQHSSARQAAGLPPLPLGDGLLCLGCGAACATLAEHAQAGSMHRPPCLGRTPLLDLRRAELYCPACGDYVFDHTFDLALQTAMAAPKGGARRGGAVTGQDDAAYGGGSASKAADRSGGGQAGSQDAASALLEGFAPVAADGFPAGLRGLNNLGNTCFMNSVLQALLHAPLLRNHYLLNRHSRAGCAISADGGYCVNCELDGVFSAAYSGRRAGYSPAQFLYTWWMLAGGHMAGYQQQDAHEFFCFILEMMGAASPGAECITRSVFGGTLRSDVICSSCGHVSTSHEQFSHLSVDVPPPQQLIAPTILARPTGGSQATVAASASAAGTAPKAAKASGSRAAPAGGGKGSGGGGSKKAAGSSSKAAANGAGKATKLVGAAKLSHERALARKAAEAAAAAGAAAGSDGTAVTVPGQASAGPHADRLKQEQQLWQIEVPQQLPDDGSSEPELIEMCASDSMSLGGFGGMLGQSGLEGASGVHMGGAALAVDDDAMDTLSSPRQQLIGVLPEMIQRAVSGVGAAVAGLWPASSQQPPAAQQQQQQQQQARPGGAAAGRPPMPPGSRQGRAGAGSGAAGPGARRGPGAGLPAQQAQRAQHDSGSPEVDHSPPPEASGMTTAAAAAAAGAIPGVGGAVQDALAATTNVPGTQDGAAAGAAAAAALPPHLAGYYRWPGASLLGCLNRFTRAEQLGPSEKWVCDRCASGRHAVKQLSLRRLPPLLVFHTKRFEHAGGLRAVAKKLDSHLTFPLRDLDMRPYLASSVLRSRFRLPPGGEAAAADPAACLYDLYAVVCHRGSFQGGHYVCYVKAADQRWYLCDDAWVTAADEEAVRNCQAYMLFYSQRALLDAREPAAAAAAAARGQQRSGQAPRRK